MHWLTKKKKLPSKKNFKRQLVVRQLVLEKKILVCKDAVGQYALEAGTYLLYNAKVWIFIYLRNLTQVPMLGANILKVLTKIPSQSKDIIMKKAFSYLSCLNFSCSLANLILE